MESHLINLSFPKTKKPLHSEKLLIGYCKCKELILYNLFYYQFFFCLEF